MLKKIYFSLLLILYCTLFLPSCINENPNDNKSDISDYETDISGTESIEWNIEIPKIDMNGLEIKFLVPGPKYVYYESFDIYAEELNDELINDEVYRRNSIIEKQFNCKILADKDTDIESKARENIRAGLTNYDVYMPFMHSAAAVASEGVFVDLKTLQYLNLDQTYWDQELNKYLTFDGKLYFTTGDISMLDNDCTMVMFFNKKIIRDENLDDPYQLVKEHKWTLEKVFEMSKDFTADNGDGVMNTEDKYGLHVAFNAPHSFFFAGGGRMTVPNSSGGFDIVINSEKNISYINKIYDITQDSKVLTNLMPGAQTFEDVCDMFVQGQILFTTFALIDMHQFKDVTNFEFGILPYPLADESQEEYISLVSTSLVPVICIPINGDHTEETSIIVDALARESVTTVTPAYYEKLLKNRTLQDEESQEMLDIIFKNRAYDTGFIFNWGGIGGIFEDIYYSPNKNFVSTYESQKSAINTEMEKTIEKFKSIS